jgi:hypothetical protein
VHLGIGFAKLRRCLLTVLFEGWHIFLVKPT